VSFETSTLILTVIGSVLTPLLIWHLTKIAARKREEREEAKAQLKRIEATVDKIQEALVSIARIETEAENTRENVIELRSEIKEISTKTARHDEAINNLKVAVAL